MNRYRLFLYYVEYLLFRAVAFLINLLDVPKARQLAEGIGYCLFWLLKSRREIALRNLRAALSCEKSEQELLKIAIGSMQNLVKVAFEFTHIPKMIQNQDVLWEIQGAEKVWKALERKKGLIVTVSHFGNWELMGLAAAKEGFPLHAVARPVKNPYVYAYIKRLRRLAGFHSIEKAGAARSVIKLLKHNQMVAILIDQHERQGGIWVDFFGRKASTTSLPALLALKYDVPVIPTFFYRGKPDFFVLSFGEPFPLIGTGNYESDLLANTQQYVRHIESEIRKRPGDWLWMHRRWREPKLD
jgi:KDO2-lipid IV(A) lauroyltransferase